MKPVTRKSQLKNAKSSKKRTRKSRRLKGGFPLPTIDLTPNGNGIIGPRGSSNGWWKALRPDVIRKKWPGLLKNLKKKGYFAFQYMADKPAGWKYKFFIVKEDLKQQHGGSKSVHQQFMYNECLANSLYRQLGVNVPLMNTVKTIHGKAVAVEIKTGYKSLEPWKAIPILCGGGPSQWQLDELFNNMLVDMWLMNWDVIGLEYDNILFNEQSQNILRIDQGGALLYRAQGSKKERVTTDYSMQYPTWKKGEWNSFRTWKNYQNYGGGGEQKCGPMREIAAAGPSVFRRLALPGSGIETKFTACNVWIADNKREIPAGRAFPPQKVCQYLINGMQKLKQLSDATLKAEINGAFPFDKEVQTFLLTTLKTRKARLIGAVKKVCAKFAPQPKDLLASLLFSYAFFHSSSPGCPPFLTFSTKESLI